MTRPKLVSVALPKQTPIRRARIPMNSRRREIEYAIEVFVRGHSAGKSRTFPYEVRRMRSLVGHARCAAPESSRLSQGGMDRLRRGARQSGCGGAMPQPWALLCRRDGRERRPDEPTRAAYRCLGYRLLATEGFFVQRLRRIPKVAGSTADRTRANTRAGVAVWHRPRAHAPSCRAYSRLTPLSVSMWRWMGRKSWAGYAAWMRSGLPGAQTCTSTRTIGGAGLDRRCCAECCATIAPAARSVQC